MKLDEKLSPRSRLLLFQTLELLRKEIESRFSDWKDADDWLFSQLDFTKDELAQIYKGRNVLYHDFTAVDIDNAKLFGEKQKSIELLIGRPIFSDEAQVVIDDLRVMLGVDVLDINESFDTDAERQDMVRYVERIIHEYNLEKEEQNLKDGFHGYMNASIPLEDIDVKPNLEEVISEAEARCEKKKTWAEERAEELAQKPRSEWDEDDWSAHNYIENLNAEADYYDGLDDR